VSPNFSGRISIFVVPPYCGIDLPVTVQVWLQDLSGARLAGLRSGFFFLKKSLKNLFPGNKGQNTQMAGKKK